MKNEYMVTVLEAAIRDAESTIAKLRRIETSCNQAGGEKRKRWNRDWREVWDTKAALCSQLAAATPLDYASREDLVREVLLIEAGRREGLADEHHRGNVKMSREAYALRHYVREMDLKAEAQGRKAPEENIFEAAS